MLASSQAVLPALYQLPYDPVNDITPIARLTAASVILVVNPDLPVKSAKDLVDYGKKNPDTITYGYQGGPIQIACALFAKLAGFQPVAVPFTASAQVATEMLAGRLTYTVMTGEQAKPLVDAGKLRALATAGTKRALAFPDIPTLDELGYPAYGDGWFGLIGPKNLPKPIVDKLYTAFKDHYYDKQPQHLLVARGMEPANDGPEAFTAFLKADIARWISAGSNSASPRSNPDEPPRLQFHNRRVAISAPSVSALSLAHATSGWTSSPARAVAKPQSVPAMTFSRPTTLAKRSMRSATSSGCST